MRRVLLLGLLPLLACSSDDTTTPVDAGKDVAAIDATVDAPKDAPADVASDAVVDATTDAKVDASAEASTDASDAAADAKADVADAGGSVWKTPTCDGTIASGEYGSAGNELTTGGGQVWSMTWNATNLYVAVTNATVTEGIVLYAGFGGNNGLTSGQIYDVTAPGTMIFKADAVLYAKSTYNEVRKVAGNAWGLATASAATFCGSGTTREIVVPWAALGANVIPPSFRWVAYATSASGFVYGQVPTTNPGGNIGINANFPHDFFVSSTNDGAGAFPFGTVE